MIQRLAASVLALGLALSASPSTAGAAAYQGCYTDDGNRAFDAMLGYNHTVESCVAAAGAAGFAYAGLQYYGQCFAGNDLGYQRVADSECNTACTANAGQMCGGPWRNSIYAAFDRPSTCIKQDTAGQYQWMSCDGLTCGVSACFDASLWSMTCPPDLTDACATGPVTYEGWLDVASCDRVSGWVWAPSAPTVRLDVQILDESGLLATVVAREDRPDVRATGRGDGLYGFTWTHAPMTGNHTITTRTSSGWVLYGAPRAVSCDASASTVTGKDVPVTMVPFESYRLQITMRNDGATTWTTGGGYRLVGAGAGWSLPATDLPVSVPAGGSYTFAFDVTAPALEGPSELSWRMERSGVGFGATASASVTVSLSPSTVALLRDDGTVACSGTMIGATTVLTAAHCRDKLGRASARVRGRYRLPAGGYQDVEGIGDLVVLYPVSDASYAGATSTWTPDLAVLRLRWALELPRARLDAGTAGLGSEVTVAGFGITHADPGGGKKHFGINTVTDGTGWFFQQRWRPELGGGVCAGDSGGSVFRTRPPWSTAACLTGVVAYNIPGPTPHTPMIPADCEVGAWHTRVAPWVWWIRAVAADPTIEGC